MTVVKKIRKRTTAFFAAHRPLSLLFGAVLLVAGALLLAAGVELIQRGSAHAVWTWIDGNRHSYYMNAGIDFFVLLLIYCLVGSLFLGLSLTALLLFVVSLVSYYKTKLIGDPFMPWDLFLKKEGMDIIPLVTGTSAMLKLAYVVAIALAVMLFRLFLPKLKLPIVYRGLAALVACFMLYSLSFKPVWTGDVANKLGIQDINWNQAQNYDVNGVTLGFAMNVKNAVVPKPPGYNQAAVETIAAALPASLTAGREDVAVAKSGGLQPNVIFIMSESFWDPTLLPDITFSEDPLPTIHKLQQTTTSGYLLSPQFGGGTANVEFEVLTGESMSLLPAGSIPYQQYIGRPTPSLASYFGDQGYKSMGIHTYEGWFWNRNTVYKNLGFQSFMSKEYFSNPSYSGGFISDDEMANAVIKQVDSTDKPMFIYSVTMQNHGPYDMERYSTNPITATGDKLTADSKSMLEMYTHGAHEADQSLQKLIDHFSLSDEPTVIVFYGDHLPMLGYDYEIYRQGGFVGSANSAEWSLEETRKMHSTPLVMWSNFPMETEKLPAVSSSFLGSYVLDRLGMQQPAQFAFNYDLYTKMPGLLKNLVVGADGELHAQVPETFQNEVNQYRDLQYDTLFGKQFLQQITNENFLVNYPVQGYNEEFTDVAITSIEQKELASGEIELTISGKNFYDGAYAVVNGKKVAPDSLSSDTMVISVTKDLLKKQDSLSIQVKQLNSKNVQLAQSNVVQVDVNRPPV
ncbi:LTA synthase family protein [Paenibacillus cymbidii]|uniref:LTA synthase family protein n=1 Tax=Paenibacillus cymbidii TaxID=1639034 RepID=UPI0010814F38|nr:LTA synthase family protein [Paenibacillus cymbidii]